MSGLPDKEIGSGVFFGVDILPDRSCLMAFGVSSFLGRWEIPWCSCAFVDGAIAGVIGASLQIELALRLPLSSCGEETCCQMVGSLVVPEH